MADIQVLVPLSVFQMADGTDPAKNVKALVNAAEQINALQSEVNRLSDEMRDVGFQLENMLDTQDGMQLSKSIRTAIGVLKGFKSTLETHTP